MAGTSSSYADRIARQFEQQYGRPADANDPQYAEYVKIALPQMIQADREALARSQGRWRTMDKIATGATLGLLGAGIGSAIAGGGAASGASGTGASGSAGSLSAIEGGAPWAVTPYAAPVAATGTGLSAATVGTGTAVGAGGAAAGAGGAAKGILGNLSARDMAALGLTGTSLIGSALSDPPNMDPTTRTTDPNLQKLIQTMQGRLTKSEPLYDSILSMANGLLPTQYQKGGGGMG